MRLTHINVTMPKGAEGIARSFYGGCLGLREIPKPEMLRARGGVWFDAGGLDIHVSVEEHRFGPDALRHFGIECADVDGVRARLKAAGIETEDGRPAPWRRFFVRDPFGNRIEVHEHGGFRG
jgi:catechol 2,3-dioxygenase-like lactoylglutathione lyase family enzyme